MSNNSNGIKPAMRFQPTSMWSAIKRKEHDAYIQGINAAMSILHDCRLLDNKSRGILMDELLEQMDDLESRY